ncbi:MAG: PQQ-binding-like beta-propeller repeat protein [Verrucomicrobia bacterium]|nr:PQQ-binding-like beta-propeller repeat protein [Verrucomicrobiota bacterium]
MKLLFRLLRIVPGLGAGLSFATAAEWSHLMGPNLDRKAAEPAPARWTAGQPRRVWETPAVGGFSSFVTGGGRAYTVILADGEGGKRETAIAVDRQNGKELWRTTLGIATYEKGGDRGAKGNDGGDGPRATPVFADGRIFVFGSKFDLYALQADTGKVIWKRDLIKEHGGKAIQWSNAITPLLVGDRLLVAGGGEKQTYLALRPATGEVIWKSGTDRPTHATPALATIHGQQQAIFLMVRGLVAIDPADGRELWHYPFPFRVSTAASPVVWNDMVFCTAGYGVGGAACQLKRDGSKWEVTELWRSPSNKDTAAHWSTPVVHEGYMYGCYGYAEYGTAAFKCVDIRTGKVQWSQPGFGHGQVIMAGNRLIATSDGDRLVLLEPDPKAYREVVGAKVIEGKVWASPALSGGQVLLRSTTHGVCLEL